MPRRCVHVERDGVQGLLKVLETLLRRLGVRQVELPSPRHDPPHHVARAEQRDVQGGVEVDVGFDRDELGGRGHLFAVKLTYWLPVR